MRLGGIISSLGPGLLWAGAAIGVSHLVQSTRAGSMYGFELVWVIILINIIKYPFFEYGPRYAAATGENLLDGYKRLGKLAVVMYLVLTIATMFTIQAAVTMVTAGLFANVFGISADLSLWSSIILVLLGIIVVFGKYSLLDKLIKVIIVILALSALLAFVFALFKGYNPNPEFAKDFNWEFSDIALLIAFAGWMPSAIDISVWHSTWTVAKKKQQKGLTVRTALFDFKVGYWGTVGLSIIFLSLGALVMYGTGNEFSSKGVAFAGQLIDLFTSGIGSWAYYIIAIAALTTMVSTTLTCLDAYPRVLKPTTEILVPKLKSAKEKSGVYWVWLIIVITGAILVVYLLQENMASMIDMATTLSFITAPLLGYLNYKVVTGKNMPNQFKPGTFLRTLSWIGLIILTGVSVYYIIWKFFVV